MKVFHSLKMKKKYIYKNKINLFYLQKIYSTWRKINITHDISFHYLMKHINFFLFPFYNYIPDSFFSFESPIPWALVVKKDGKSRIPRS